MFNNAEKKFIGGAVAIAVMLVAILMCAMIMFGNAKADTYVDSDGISDEGTITFNVAYEGECDYVLVLCYDSNYSVVNTYSLYNDGETKTIDGKEYFLYSGDVYEDYSKIVYARLYPSDTWAEYKSSSQQFYPTADSNLAIMYTEEDQYYYKFLKETTGFSVSATANPTDACTITGSPITGIEYGASISLSTDKTTVEVTKGDETVGVIVATPSSGYAIDKWDGIPTDGTVSSNLTLTCYLSAYVPTITTVHFNASGGTGGPESKTFTYGTKPTDLGSDELPSFAGKVFEGYFDDTFKTKYFDSEGKFAQNSWDITDSEYTLYAKWADPAVVTHELTCACSPVEGGYVSQSTLEVPDGTKLSVEPDNPSCLLISSDDGSESVYAYANDDYKFLNWDLDGRTIVDEDMTLTAKFSKIQSTQLTFDLVGGYLPPNYNDTVVYGEELEDIYDIQVTLPGYTFAGFYDSAESGKQYFDKDGVAQVDTWDKTEAECTLYAQYTEGQSSTRDKSLSFSADSEDMDGGNENWCWEKSTHTLTLKGIDFKEGISLIPDSDFSIKDITILLLNNSSATTEDVLTDSTDLNTENNLTGIFSLWGFQNVLFTGGGTLNISDATAGISFLTTTENSMFNVDKSKICITNCDKTVWSNKQTDDAPVMNLAFDLANVKGSCDGFSEGDVAWNDVEDPYGGPAQRTFVMSQDHTKVATNLVIDTTGNVQPIPSSDDNTTPTEAAQTVDQAGNATSASSSSSTNDSNLALIFTCIALSCVAAFVAFRIRRKI